MELLKPGGILRKCKKELARIWIAQGSMLMDTRSKDKHVPLAAYDSKKVGDLEINTW